jgi:hypothetical protein
MDLEGLFPFWPLQTALFVCSEEMFVLFETPAGFGLFKVLNEGKLKNPENLWKEFEDLDNAKKIVSLVEFQKFDSTGTSFSFTPSFPLNNPFLQSKLWKLPQHPWKVKLEVG